MKEIYYKKLLEQLEIAGKQNIVFWGASLFLKEFIKEINLKKYNIVGIIDEDSEKWGKIFEGYKIYPPLKIQELQPVYIVFTSQDNAIEKHSETLKIINQLRFNQVCLFPNIFEEKDYRNTSKSNNIYLIKNGKKEKVNYILGIDIIFTGENNTVEIEADPLPIFNNCKFEISDNSYIKIGCSGKIGNLFVRMVQESCKLTIGKNFFISEGSFFFNHASEIEIGDDCMFSSDIYLRTSDGHAIYDAETKELINKYERKSINIGNHVWLGNGVSVLKNSKICDNSIVGKSSIVNKKFNETNVILAGSPAKIVKTNVNWDHKPPLDYEIENKITFDLIKKTIKNKKVLFWGASLFLGNLLKQEKEILPNILGIVDRDSNKWGKDFYGYKIISPDEIESKVPEAILVTIATKIYYYYEVISKEVKEKHPTVEILPNIFEKGLHYD